MNRTYIQFLICLLLCNYFGFSQQNKFDSIEVLLKSNLHDTAKCSALLGFIESGLEEDEWPIYNEKLLNFSLNAAKNAKKELKKAFYSYYYIALSNKGFLATEMGDFLTAEKIYKQTLEGQKRINYTEGIGITYINLGANANSQGNVKLALEYYHSALNVFLKNGNTNSAAVAYNNLAYLFESEKDYKNAIMYFELSLDLHKKMKDFSGMATAYGNLAHAYPNSKNLDSLPLLTKYNILNKSLLYLKRAEKIYDSLNQNNKLAISQNQLGSFYDLYGDIEIQDDKKSKQYGDQLALKYYKKSLDIRLKTKHSFGQIQSYNSLSKYMYKQNNLKEAINYSQKCLELAEKTDNLLYKSLSAKYLYTYYKQLNKYTESLKMYELYVKCNDSLNNSSIKKAIIQKSFQLEYEKKAAADSVKVAEERKISQLKLKQEKTQKQYLYIGLFAITLFGIFMFNRFRVTKKQKNIIEQQKIIVEQQKALVDEKQKEILDSIRYAKRIQQALMPSKKYISEAINVKNTLIVFCCFLTLSYFGQDKKIDSLKKELIYASNDTSKCLVLESLISLEKDEDLIVKYNNELMRIAQNKLKKQTKDKNIFTQFLAEAYNNKGVINNNKGNIPLAIKCYEECLKLGEFLNDSIGMAQSLNNLGVVYNSQQNFEKALEYHHKSLVIRETIDEKEGIAISLSNIGSIYKDLGKLDEALKYFEKSLEIKKVLGKKKLIAKSLNKIATIYLLKKDNKKALKYYQNSLEICEELEYAEGLSIVLTGISNLYFNEKQLKLSEKYGLQAMAISKELGYPKNIKESALLLFKIYKEIGNSKLALNNYELYISMRDSINNSETRKASIKSQLKYEYEKKAAADSVKVAEERKISQLKLKQEKTQKQYLYIGLFAITLFGIFMFNRFRVTKKQKAIIEQQKVVVEQQKALVDEKQKEIIDSIRYAKRIQDSLMPSRKYLYKKLNSNA